MKKSVPLLEYSELMKPKRIIAIGASAGGLNALRRLFTDLDSHLPAAIFVVLHIASDSHYLTSLLERSSKLPVRAAEDGPIEEGMIYIAPADAHLMLEQDSMHLVKGPKENRHRPSIDVLFRSAAYAYRSAVIGVVLTGMLDDGTAGLFSIKRFGGIAVVQDPSDAEFKSMPLNASTYVRPDYVVPLDEMAALLNRLARQQPPSISVVEPPAESPGTAIREDDARNGRPSFYTCPECQGPLLEIRDGSLTRFRCNVGHAYGLASMVYSQAESTERALWSALQSLKAKTELEKTLMQVAERHEDPSAREKYQKRLKDSEQAVRFLEQALKLSNGEGNAD
jgi:two-component system chemotaxis response regulator CheB